MRMSHALDPFRSMLDRTVTVDEALTAYLGRHPHEADRQAEDERTGDGMLMARLRDLVTILAIREAPADLAMLVAALIWRSAPVAETVGELRDAIRRICDWRSGLNDGDVARITEAHRTYKTRFEEAMARADMDAGDEIQHILDDLSEASEGNTVVAELGPCLLIVEMTDTDFFVGVQDEDDVIIVMDRVPRVGDGGWDRGEEHTPTGPRPLTLLDA
jgi:hypothetical protein